MAQGSGRGGRDGTAAGGSVPKAAAAGPLTNWGGAEQFPYWASSPVKGGHWDLDTFPH